MRNVALAALAATLSGALSLQQGGEPDGAVAQGLSLEIASLDGKHVFTRRARCVALFVPVGAQPASFVPAGPFRATWRGFVNVPLRDRYSFTFEGAGAFELSIGGKVVLQVDAGTAKQTTKRRVRLRKGGNEIVARLTSPPAGPTRVRLHWKAEEEPYELVPPRVFSYAANDVLTRDAIAARGREVVRARNCTACHELAGAEPAGREHGPSLDAAGARLRPSWVVRWLSDPKALRPQARMPAVLRGSAAQREREARDVAAFLTTLDTDVVRPGATGRAAAGSEGAGSEAAGGARFARLGCIACHTRPDAAKPFADPDRLPLAFVRAKYRSTAVLADFLADPARRHGTTRMPNFQLSAAEARDLAAFLFARAREPFEGDVQGDAERGRALVEERGCLRCHGLERNGVADRLRARPWRDVLATGAEARGCLGEGGTGPAFQLAPGDRAAIGAFGRIESAMHAFESSIERAERQVEELRCAACHTYDQRGNVWDRLAADVADLVPKSNHEAHEVSQRRPSMTWFGEKLETSWMTRFLSGEIREKPRPWLQARMPAFVAHAKSIAAGLSHAHGLSTEPEARPKPDVAMAKVGAWLAGRKGFSCVLCHAVGDDPAKEVFEAHGVNFAIVTARLRKAYFHRWMQKPDTIEKGTRMPQIPDEEGMTHFTEIYEGDSTKQFEAIWQYLLHGSAIPKVDESDR